MSVFAVVSNDVVLTVGPYAEVHALATEQAKRGNRVALRRATPAEKGLDTRGWAVRVSAANVSDLLRCLDGDDARSVLREIRGNGVSAEIVRV